jgi:oligopeptide/dipeptide ABC transporter ATP-binding protein
VDASRRLLEIRDLTLSFPARHERVRILDAISLWMGENEIVGLVGESGSGKSLTALATMRFLPPTARVEAGEILFEGVNLLALEEKAMRDIRGRRVAMVFQSSRSALNPLMRVGDQVARVYQLQGGMTPGAAHRAAVDILRRVGIPDAERRARAFPHQISGGMAQRVLVAMMIACRPALLIADEPTTGLDVTIQAQIFELLKDIQAETRASVLLITHDLGVVAETCRRMVVMYAGQIMETGDSASIFAGPRHPYTQHLLSSVMRVDRTVQAPRADGQPSEALLYAARGCRFVQRCPWAAEVCHREALPRIEAGPGHLVMCHRDGERHAAAAQS